MTIDELLDLTVNEQEDELENLSVSKLRELKEEEERQTAIDNINSEIGNRMEDGEHQTVNEGNRKTVDEDVEKAVEETFSEEEIAELERKVDYIIERCKTTSHEGFDNYE